MAQENREIRQAQGRSEAIDVHVNEPHDDVSGEQPLPGLLFLPGELLLLLVPGGALLVSFLIVLLLVLHQQGEEERRGGENDGDPDDGLVGFQPLLQLQAPEGFLVRRQSAGGRVADVHQARVDLDGNLAAEEGHDRLEEQVVDHDVLEELRSFRARRLHREHERINDVEHGDERAVDNVGDGDDPENTGEDEHQQGRRGNDGRPHEHLLVAEAMDFRQKPSHEDTADSRIDHHSSDEVRRDEIEIVLHRVVRHAGDDAEQRVNDEIQVDVAFVSGIPHRYRTGNTCTAGHGNSPLQKR